MNATTLKKLNTAVKMEILEEDTYLKIINMRIERDESEDQLGSYHQQDGNDYITIYPNTITKYYDKGYQFYGIKPKSYEDAEKLVIEHEFIHIIMSYQYPDKPSGHTVVFNNVAWFVFYHTNSEVEDEIPTSDCSV